jgi:copper chaperone
MSESVTINVNGMKCSGCEKTINTLVSAIDGVVSVKASHVDKTVDVEFDPDKTDLEALEDCISDAGFEVQ